MAQDSQPLLPDFGRPGATHIIPQFLGGFFAGPPREVFRELFFSAWNCFRYFSDICSRWMYLLPVRIESPVAELCPPPLPDAWPHGIDQMRSSPLHSAHTQGWPGCRPATCPYLHSPSLPTVPANVHDTPAPIPLAYIHIEHRTRLCIGNHRNILMPLPIRCFIHADMYN